VQRSNIGTRDGDESQRPGRTEAGRPSVPPASQRNCAPDCRGQKRPRARQTQGGTAWRSAGWRSQLTSSRTNCSPLHDHPANSSAPTHVVTIGQIQLDRRRLRSAGWPTAVRETPGQGCALGQLVPQRQVVQERASIKPETRGRQADQGQGRRSAGGRRGSRSLRRPKSTARGGENTIKRSESTPGIG